MSMRPTLVVPVALDALVITPAVLNENTFRVWRQSYTALADYGSPEPDEGDRQVSDPKLAGAGVHLHWTLPRGLRHGVQDEKSGQLTFPLVPNRWLVTRFSGTTSRTAKSWVIESDCPHSAYAVHNGGHEVAFSTDHLVAPDVAGAWRTSADPYRNQAEPDDTVPGSARVPIGLAFDADSWTERAAADPLFLTALGAGNPSFASYTPHNSNIFSCTDDLADLGYATTLGYHVIGWYSDPDADILATLPPGATYAEHLAHLQWQDPRLTGDADHDAAVTPATRSLYSGQALTVAWDPDGPAPARDPLRSLRDSGALDVAIGNTTEDAFAALAGRAVDDAAGLTVADMQLLRAFLHGLLARADESGGDAKVLRGIRDSWFDATAGGYHWTITPPPTPDGAPANFTTPDWLDTLNDDQRSLDAQLGLLASSQWRLNALWLKRGLVDALWPAPDDAPDPDEMDAQLDPDRDGLAATVRGLTDAVRALADAVPQPDPDTAHATAHQALRAGIGAFAATRDLPAGATLKAIPKSSFWQSNNPVVALSGVLPPSDAVAEDRSLPVRPVDEHSSSLISRVTVSGTDIDATPGRPPMPEIPVLAALPDGAAALLAEYFLLDPGNATVLATAAGISVEAVTAALTAHDPAAYTGTLPALGLTAWTQPWQPLFMEWKAQYLPIPYTEGAQRCWTFDGTDYRYTPGTATVSANPVDIKGISALSPHPRSLFAARLEKFVTDHGTGPQRDRLARWLAAIGDWSFLAQELTGFNERLTARDSRAFRRPTPDDPHHPRIADLVGYPDAAGADSLPARYRGRVTTVPYLPGGEDAPFQEIRQGQLYFQQLFLYDKFGRVLDVVNPDTEHGGLHDYRNFPFVIDDAFATDTALDPTIAAVAQLPPRLLQPARLNFELLDGMTGTRVVGTDAEANPVGGWLLPNHLDHSLLLYDPAGALLGTYRLVTSGSRRVGQWDPPPDGAVTTLAELAARAPVVAGLIGSSKLATEADFTAFLDVIDSTLWTVDPLGARADRNLSVLLGRPLALVRAQLRLELDGTPIFDTGWAATLDPPPAAFTAYRFAVRLGDQAARDDGLIGYFTADADGTYRYDRFNSVTAPDPRQDYITRIGPLGPCATPSDANYLELTFADPAPTEVLLLMDPHASVHAVTGITPTAAVSVAPSHVQTPLDHIEALFRFGPVLTVSDKSGQSVAFPQPSEKHGSWSWLRPGPDGVWTPNTLTAVTSDARFPDTPITVEDGLLRFTTDLEDDNPEEITR
ncbi:hypothetical protein [Nocardia bovistercoris]|uniref:Uncharacterized protein n=1 Tax=Nocardia bovistercoris TaxID=2785916 RepID=A0A931N580_9NOCA|nr:hypothetical protein [Nocardia bovistercoris]MBH0779467.1 hypothetical protein [Nocardia bovistercoris]